MAAARSVTSGAGDDHLHGGLGDDEVMGGEGNDPLYAGQGNDLLTGDFGDDLMVGGGGRDLMFAGVGNDVLFGGDGIDQVSEDEDNDLMVSGSVANEASTMAGDENEVTLLVLLNNLARCWDQSHRVGYGYARRTSRRTTRQQRDDDFFTEGTDYIAGLTNGDELNPA